ncbi:MAG: hypothetical protein AABY18_07415 [Candidatus Thermoplasmatota archaeon]
MATHPIQGIAPALAVAPYAALAIVLHGLPLSWPAAIGNAALLLGLMAAHAWCYSLWQPHAPDRILANELLTRLWFATDVVLLVGLLDGALVVAALAFPLAVSSWLVHRRLVVRGYRVAENLLHLGIVLLLLGTLLVTAVP